MLLYLFGIPVQIIKEFWRPLRIHAAFHQASHRDEEKLMVVISCKTIIPTSSHILENLFIQRVVHCKGITYSQHKLGAADLHGSSNLQSSCRMRKTTINRDKLKSLICDRQISWNLYPIFNFPISSTVASKLPTSLKVRR